MSIHDTLQAWNFQPGLPLRAWGLQLKSSWNWEFGSSHGAGRVAEIDGTGQSIILMLSAPFWQVWKGGRREELDLKRGDGWEQTAKYTGGVGVTMR